MKNKKSDNHQGHRAFICPYCGNEAPYKLKYNRPVVCRYCKSAYNADERVSIKVDKH